jgi:hypothetical protein
MACKKNETYLIKAYNTLEHLSLSISLVPMNSFTVLMQQSTSGLRSPYKMLISVSVHFIRDGP